MIADCGAEIAAAPIWLGAAAGSGAGHQRADAEQHRDDRLGLRLRQLLAHAHQMPAGQVAGFVGEARR